MKPGLRLLRPVKKDDIEKRRPQHAGMVPYTDDRYGGYHAKAAQRRCSCYFINPTTLRVLITSTTRHWLRSSADEVRAKVEEPHERIRYEIRVMRSSTDPITISVFGDNCGVVTQRLLARLED